MKINTLIRLTAFLFLFIPILSFSQPKPNQLSVEKIMRDSKWIGTSPSNPFWNDDGTKLFFNWNPDQAPSDSLYYITKENKTPRKASVSEKQNVVRANNGRACCCAGIQCSSSPTVSPINLLKFKLRTKVEKKSVRRNRC